MSLLVLLILCALASFICATASERLRTLSRARLLEVARQQRSSQGEQIVLNSELYAHRGQLAATAWSGLALFWSYLAINHFDLMPTWAWLLLSLILLGIVQYILPCWLQAWFDESTLLSTWGVSSRIALLGWPWSKASEYLSPGPILNSTTEQSDEAEEDLEEEIRSMVTAGQREGLIENDEREMIESVMDLADATIAQIMTPRTEMLTLQVDTGWEELIRITSESGHSRLPVHGKSRDEIVGVLHIKDVLSELARGQRARRPLRSLLRRPFFVPESKPVNEMLQEFQRGRTHIAIVLDEYGGVRGLVTIEDVLEEIVGEIADEHDDALVDGIKQIDEVSFEALARVHLSECNARLNINLPEDENFDTLGGYVFHELGRIPVVGESLERAGVRIKVLDSNRRRIDRLLIELIEQKSAEESAKTEANS